MSGPDRKGDEVAAAVREYLERFPGARDTARGIQEWWLPARFRQLPPDVLERVLWRLVDEGSIEAARLSNGTVLFGGRLRRGPDQR